MKYKEIQTMIDSVPNAYNNAVIMHFRYATHGRIDTGNCQPFPLSKMPSQLRAMAMDDVPMAVCHNGVIPENRISNPRFFQYGGHGAINVASVQKLSDSAEFIRDFMARMGVGILGNPAVMDLIAEFTDSKFAYLTKNKLYTIGEFVEEDNLLYSNNSYKDIKFYNTSFIDDWDMDDSSRFLYHHYPTQPGEKLTTSTIENATRCDVCGDTTDNLHEIEEAAVCDECYKYFV